MLRGRPRRSSADLGGVFEASCLYGGSDLLQGLPGSLHRAFALTVTVHGPELVPEGHLRIAQRFNAGTKDAHQETKSRRDDWVGLSLSVVPTGLKRE